MKKLLLAILLLNMVISCEDESPEIDFIKLEDGVLQLVNDHRTSIGKNELIVDDVIVNECREHSRNMSEGTVIFGHDGFDDRIDRIFLQIGGTSAGENVAFGFTTADDAVQSWLNSQGHRDNIEGDFTHTGVGVWRSNGGDFYYTQIFIKK